MTPHSITDNNAHPSPLMTCLTYSATPSQTDMFVRLNENFFFCYLSLAQFAEDIKKTTLRLEVYYMVRYVIKELSV